jgi:uncharacterized repeat protein (TIGR02543 family)
MASASQTVYKQNVGFYTINVSASISSETATAVTIAWSSSITFNSGGGWYQWGAGLKTTVGSQSTTRTGACTSVGQTICSGSGSVSISKTSSAQTITFKAQSYSATVNGYGGIDLVGTAQGTLTIPALKTYTIKYDPNGGQGDTMANTVVTYGVSTNTRKNTYTKTGYDFNNWYVHRQKDNTWAYVNPSNTSQTGWYVKNNQPSGWILKYYSNGGAVSKTSSTHGDIVTFYAQWKAKTYAVTYHANGGSGAPSNQTKTYGTALTLRTDKPTKTGHTFSKWNTKADGSGTNYNSGASYTSNAAVTLYAIWTANTYTVTYDANNGSNAPSNQTKTHDKALTLSPDKPEKTGYSFKNWNTKADGSGTSYNSSASYTGNSDITLYAQWTVETYTITYNANNGTGAPQSQTKTYNEALTLSQDTPTRTGYTFLGWGTSASDTSADYAKGANFTANANTTLYAIWKKTLTLSYDANGGSGAPAAQNQDIYNAATSHTFTISNTIPTKTGYLFSGWANSTAEEVSSYATGSTININSNKTLYAVWTKTATSGHYINFKLEDGSFKGLHEFTREWLEEDPLDMIQGGTGSNNGAVGLKNLLAAGATILSSNQYGDTLPNAGTPGRIFFKKL